MADPNRKEPTELSMEKRLLLALLLMLAVLFATPYLYKVAKIGPPPAPETKTAAPKADPTPSPAAAEPAAPAPQPPPAAATPPPRAKRGAAKAKEPPPPAAIAAQSEETVFIDTAIYRVVFSNRGAVIKSWQLKKYKDSNQRELELVNAGAANKSGLPMSLVSKNQGAASAVNAALFVAKTTADGLGVDFEYSNTRITAKKSFRFAKSSYLSAVTTELTEGGAPVPHQLAWRGGFGDLVVPNVGTVERVIYFDAPANKLVTHDAKAAKDGPLSASGSFHFAGVEDLYFAAVFLPQGTGSLEVQAFSDSVPPPNRTDEVAFAGVAVGGDSRNRLSLFAGPKDLDILKQVNPKLEQVVDFGFLSFLAKPLFLIVHWLNDSYVQNYGWSIIIATIIINMALLPLKFSSLKSMKKMQVLQPEIARINEKYRGLSMKDPRKQQQNQEIMALYQKNGVNPLGGCIPLLLQMPLLFAFYKVFTIAIEMRHASWLWVSDLSQAETLPIRVLPIVFIASQFLLSKMSPPTGGDPTQQKMMQYMPLFLGVMFYGASSGLMLYWLTGNLVAIAQQWFFNRTAIPGEVAAPAKKPGRK